jgi:hypothetical protein
MQTLGLSNSTPRTESRLKSLFWPSVETGSDVDYLGAQGYWVCAIVAVFSGALLAFTGHAILGMLFFLYFYLGGVGVREHSLYAATVVLVMYALDTVTTVINMPNPVALVPRALLTALLLSNLRATWIASHWKPDGEASILPPRYGETWSDRFVDQVPMWLWPKVRILYCVLSSFLLGLVVIGLAVLAHRQHL